MKPSTSSPPINTNVDTKQQPCVNYATLLIWFSGTFALTILLATSGLLLRRSVLPNKSTCSFEMPEQCQNDEAATCLTAMLRSERQICEENNAKVVLIIIDALRYDFVKYDYNRTDKRKTYLNRMPLIETLLKHRPENARLYKMIADPPTTSMQRLNALTTGTLPTFIDIGSNFASSEIAEDNIIDQLLAQNKDIVFMGDDTWTKLYPNRFYRSYPYPSFNVWDLDTVDTGIKRHLYTELLNEDWDLLVAHFLGVDHAGHRYDPYHPEMTRKLNEMNEMLKDVFDTLRNREDDYTIFVMGDHGMTATGDHGGESDNEIGTAFFAYSTTPFFPKRDSNIRKQIDFVPTFCTIMGIPIPFANVGAVILDAIPESYLNNLLDFGAVLLRNAKQMQIFTETYSQKKRGFASDKFGYVTNLYEKFANELSNLQSNSALTLGTYFTIYTENIYELCRESFVQFDLDTIVWGIVCGISTIVLTSVIIQTLDVQKFKIIFTRSYVAVIFCPVMACLVYGFVANVGLLARNHAFVYKITILYALTHMAFICRNLIPNAVSRGFSFAKKINTESFVTFLFTIIMFFGAFSNSYVLDEPYIINFVLVTSLIPYLFHIHSINATKESTTISKTPTHHGKKYQWQWKKAFLPNKYAYWNAIIIFTLYVFASKMFIRCREEQQDYCDDHLWKLFTSEPVFKLSNFFICGFGYYFLISDKKNLNANNQWSNAVGFFLPCVLGVAIMWVWFSEGQTQYDAESNHLQSATLVVSVCCVAYTVAKPLCFFAKDALISGVKFTSQLVPNDKYTLGNNLKKYYNEEKCMLKVYTNCMRYVSIYLCVAVIVLYGNRYVASAFFTFIGIWHLSSIIGAKRLIVKKCLAEIYDTSLSNSILWAFSAIFWFYFSGHNCSFSGLDWNAAFLMRKDIGDSTFLPAILVICNTFASYIVHGLLIPLLVVSPFVSASVVSKFFGNEKVSSLYEYEFALAADRDFICHSAFLLAIKYLLFFMCRVLASLIAATVLRRHLMMWKVFAPKLIFDGIAFSMVIVPSTVLGYVLLQSVTAHLRTLLETPRSRALTSKYRV